MNSRLAISGNVRWVARYGSSRSSAPVRLIAQAPADPEVAATRSRSSRASSTRMPEVGTQLEHALGLARTVRAAAGSASARWARVSSSPTWIGQPGNAVVEQRPQPVRAGERRAGVVVPALVQGDARGRHVRDRAGRVVAEARLLDERLRRAARGARPRPTRPRLAARSASCAWASEDLVGGAGGQPGLDGRA